MGMEYRSGVHMIMRSLSDCGSSATNGMSEEDHMGIIRKGPWTEEEDSVLANYIAAHGEGHWNFVARSAGLKRTGKSCRLRWLNYLRPNVRRGNITLQEQLLILDLHSRWGNRWSKIAEQLPGRTDNEIKNYWKTRVVKQAKQLKCDVNSKQFRDALRNVWIPRLLEQIQASNCGINGPNSQKEPLVQSTACNSTQANHSMLLSSNSSSGVLQASSSVSDSCIFYNVMGGGGATSTPFELEIGFGGADLWTDENIWFLQQQLADDDF